MKQLIINGISMDYVCFGFGKQPLLLIPGLSLRGVRGASLSLAYMYRIFSKEYRVYVFDRKAVIPKGYTVYDMAEDFVAAMAQLGIQRADVFGVSQGGMIAQYMAIHHPELIRKLVLGVTASRNNQTIQDTLGNWISMAEQDKYERFICDMMEKMYTDAYLKRYKWLLPLLSKIGKPKEPERFLNLARACLTCDTYESLEKIKCPVLVLGGGKDQVVSGKASEEIAEKLKCEIHMYENLGHAAYEEAGDFNQRVYQFLQEKKVSC